jgi:hypothetical protein
LLIYCYVSVTSHPQWLFIPHTQLPDIKKKGLETYGGLKESALYFVKQTRSLLNQPFLQKSSVITGKLELWSIAADDGLC